MSIENWRTQIDDIDRKLVQLMNQRAQCAIEIAKIKKQNNMKVIDPERERDVYRNIESENHGPLDTQGMIRLFGRIIEECRSIERHVTGEK